MLTILLGITFLALGVTLRFPFMGDDLPQIAQNPRVQSWSFVPQYFTTHLWIQIPGAAPRFYRPLFLLFLRMMDAAFGLWTPGWHLMLVLCHLATAAMVYWLVSEWKDKTFALLAAALFALHPVHAEVVSWVSAISEPALAITLLGSLILVRREGARNLIAALALFAAALLLKETAIVWPVVIFLAFYDGFARSLRRTAPFIGVAVLYLLLRIAVLGSLTAPLIRAVKTDAAYVPTALSHYFFHLVWPVGLSTYCELHPNWLYLLFVLPLLAALVWIALRGQYERVAVLILLLPLLPALNLGSLQLDALVQDRYLYLPSVGFVMLAAVLLQHLPRPAMALLFMVMIAGCVEETLTYIDGEHFYARGLQAAPHNSEVREGLGRVYANQGKFQQAVEVLEPVLQAGNTPAPLLEPSLLTLAYSHEQLGHIQAAVAYYSAADKVSPDPDVERHILYLQSQLRALP
jgi:tetratricopeptide (TPR) repeat protein